MKAMHKCIFCVRYLRFVHKNSSFSLRYIAQRYNMIRWEILGSFVIFLQRNLLFSFSKERILNVTNDGMHYDELNKHLFGMNIDT